MSEFSQSYHLLGSAEAAIELIKRAGEQGFVFDNNGRWTTFVISGDQFVPSDSIVKANTGTLVHYVYAEDHGWSLSIFKQSAPIFHYNCSWDDMEDYDLTEEELAEMVGSGEISGPADEIFDLAVVARLVEEAQNDATGLEALFTKDTEAIFEMEIPSAYQIAEKLGISNFTWISADYIDGDDDYYKNVIKV